MWHLLIGGLTYLVSPSIRWSKLILSQHEWVGFIINEHIAGILEKGRLFSLFLVEDTKQLTNKIIS